MSSCSGPNGDSWLAVPQAAEVAAALEMEFVPYRLVSTDLTAVNAERDRPSEVAARRGMGSDKLREGVVLRPPFEVTMNDGERLIAKHKRAEFAETATAREVDPARLAVLSDAAAIAQEWVTPMRLTHALDALSAAGTPALSERDTGRVVVAMLNGIRREAFQND